jgi:hypothetical protein
MKVPDGRKMRSSARGKLGRLFWMIGLNMILPGNDFKSLKETAAAEKKPNQSALKNSAVRSGIYSFSESMLV